MSSPAATSTTSDATSIAADGDTPVAAVSPLGSQRLKFTLNGMSLKRGLTDLPATLDEFQHLAEMIHPDTSLTSPVRIISSVEDSDGAHELMSLETRSDIRTFWSKVSQSEGVRIDIRVQSCKSGLPRRLWFFGKIVLVLVAIVFPAASCLLAREHRALAAVGRELGKRIFAGPEGEGDGDVLPSPKRQLTSFALANIGTGSENSEHDILNRMVMVDVRSYHKTVLFEAASAQKNHAVIAALGTTNLDAKIIQKIAELVANTSLLVDQFSDFAYQADGRACSFTVNVWVSAEKQIGKASTGKVDVALMVSGASFGKSAVQAEEEVEEPVFEEHTMEVPATWLMPAHIERRRVPVTADGVTQLTRKTKRPIFNTSQISTKEIELLRAYLVRMSSIEALRNYDPSKLLASTLQQSKIMMASSRRAPPEDSAESPTKESSPELRRL